MNYWLILKNQLIDILKGKFVKAALKKVLGSAAAGGFTGWLVKYIAIELFEEVFEPLIRYGIRKGLLVVDKIDGNIKAKKIEKAKDDNDEDAYRNTIGDV